MRGPPVSACLIVRNEAPNLAACVEPWRFLVDDLVVVDTGSEDGTKDVARALGARVFDFAWCDDFSAARNEALRHAVGEWVLSMDADDRVDQEGVAKLGALLSSVKELDGYLMHCVCASPTGSGRISCEQVRLFRRDPAFLWERRVHEQIAPSIVRANGTLGETDIAIHHLGYHDPIQFRRKAERNLRLLELEFCENQFSGEFLHLKGGTLLDLGRTEEAISCLGQAARFSLGDDDSARMVFLKLATAHVRRDDLGSALETLRSGLSSFPRDRDLLWLEAQVTAACGEYRQAEEALAVLRTGAAEAPRFAIVDEQIPLFAEVLYCRVCLHQGRGADAEGSARAAISRQRSFGPAWLALGEALLMQGKTRTFEALRAFLSRGHEGVIGVAVLASLESLQRGDPVGALSVLDEALASHPGEPLLACAKVRALLASGAPGPAIRELVGTVLQGIPLDVDARALVRASRSAGLAL
jgi:glycosyltransferase involved in cell wall biosynthesis